MQQPTVTIWYDGNCQLCLREIALMRRLDRAGRISFVDAADLTTICPRDRTAMLARFHALENGVLLSGAAAFGTMWRAIPLLRPLGLAAKVPAVAEVLEWAYRQFLKVRPVLRRRCRYEATAPDSEG